MLSEQTKLLLAAFIDGALVGPERDAAERLQRESAEARAFIRTLHEHSRRLRSLPKRSLSGDFPGWIVAQLPPPKIATPISPAAPLDIDQPEAESFEILVQKPRVRKGLPAWAVGGIAASIVAVVVLGGLALVRDQLQHNRDLLPKGNGDTPFVSIKPTPKVNEPNAVDQLVSQIVRAAGERYGERKPEIAPVPKNQPVRFAFGDLHKQDSFDYLKWELSQTSGVHLDVTVKYNARSLNRVIESFHKHGVPLLVTPPAKASLAKGQPLLVYAENVQADKLALALRDLGEADIQGTKREPSTFDAVRVAPDSTDDHRRIAKRLGIDEQQLKSPTGPKSQVASAGVILSSEGIAEPGNIREIAEFLAGRGPVRNGTLQVFLQLQPNGK